MIIPTVHLPFSLSLFPILCKTSSAFTLLKQIRICNHTYVPKIYAKSFLFNGSLLNNSSNQCTAKSLLFNRSLLKHSSNLCTVVLKDPSSSSLPRKMYNKMKKQALRNLPENVLKYKLGICSKHGDLAEGIRLYEEARLNGTHLNIHHYNALLYLCSCSESEECVDNWGLDKGFEIFKQMGADKVVPDEATFTSMARLAANKDDPDLAFELIKTMKSCGIQPKLRSYGPPLFGFCKIGLADKAYEVDEHMEKCGVVAEEEEITALLKVSSEQKRGDKVYEMMHRLRTTVRQVTEDTANVLEDWFVSQSAADVGVEKWNEGKVKERIAKGGGGWHGQGWLGKGKWKVTRTQMNENGVCVSCREKLVCIDIDPKETEKFASSLEKLATKTEVGYDFANFKEWLQRHGPFDSVVDGTNVSLVNQRYFSFFQLNSTVNQLRQISPSKRLPLVILHKCRVHDGPAQHPSSKKLLHSLKNAGALYVTPPGSNDDWYWLYAAVSCQCLLVTNDEMRDHLFQLLGTSFFPRWKEKHQVRLACSKGLHLYMPPPYSSVIQESEQGHWHIPTVTGDDLETPRQWLCSTRSKKLHSLFS